MLNKRREMGTTVYFFFFLLIAFAYGVNLNEENNLGPGQPTSTIPYLEQHGQGNDDTQDIAEKVIVEAYDEQQITPYFINMKKMTRIQIKPKGNMIHLKCKAGGYPSPNVTWYKNNEVPRRQSGDIRYGQWCITLEQLIVDDSGIYKCVVCNSLGCINFNYTVDVIERYHNRPIITKPPQNKTVVVGSNVTFSCTVISDLQPYIYWVTRIPFEKDIVKNNDAAENPEVLELFNVKFDSEGWYTCVAANSLGSTNSSAYLKVVDDNVAKLGKHINHLGKVVQSQNKTISNLFQANSNLTSEVKIQGDVNKQIGDTMQSFQCKCDNVCERLENVQKTVNIIEEKLSLIIINEDTVTKKPLEKLKKQLKRMVTSLEREGRIGLSEDLTEASPMQNSTQK